MQRKSKVVEPQNAKRLSINPTSRGLCGNAKFVRARRIGKLRSFWEDKIHNVLETNGENPVVYRVQAENDPNGRTRNLHRNMLQPCDELLDSFTWNLTKKDKIKPGSTIKNKKQKVEKHKEVQQESSEDELTQFTLARMRPLIDDTRLLEKIKQATTKEEDLTNENQTGRTNINNNHEVLPESLNINQENKQETPEQFQEVDFQKVLKTKIK